MDLEKKRYILNNTLEVFLVSFVLGAGEKIHKGIYQVFQDRDGGGIPWRKLVIQNVHNLTGRF